MIKGKCLFIADLLFESKMCIVMISIKDNCKTIHNMFKKSVVDIRYI